MKSMHVFRVYYEGKPTEMEFYFDRLISRVEAQKIVVRVEGYKLARKEKS